MTNEDVKQLLGEQIGYHMSFDLPEAWAEEYRQGYIDGLKQARAVLTNTPSLIESREHSND
jgi:hypothetical protein